MALLKVLDRHGVPYDKEEVGKRLDLLMKGLRRDPKFSTELEAFRKESPQKAGGQYDIPIPIKMTQGDFLGSEARWFIEVMGSPYIQVAVRVLFLGLFFLSAIENIPIAGSIVGAALDIITTSGRVLIKTIQKIIPVSFALVPLPYMNFVGMGVAAAIGLLLWPIIAMVSLSRQDFTSAIESFIRIIPPPIGDGLADTFLDANRAAYRLNEKRKKVADDLVSGLKTIMAVSKQTGTKIGEGATALITKAREAAAKPVPASTAVSPSETPAKVGGRFSRKVHKKSKWRKTRRRNS